MSVSAIIPSFRDSDLLPRALESVKAQTRPPDEIIVIDDGSPPDHAEAVRAAAEKYGAQLVRQENRGLASARNAGWNAASARYVAFLDADDAWHPRKLETQLAIMESRPELVLTAHDFTVGPPFPELPAKSRLRKYRWTWALI